ncbi:hypothetical protein PMIT1320_00036 [Prochlorococcus marinus str. MIT 1320]|nr:hypothetical protein PMIT1320_00036 [Prochlorococcus marinus str. MIT 1320]
MSVVQRAAVFKRAVVVKRMSVVQCLAIRIGNRGIIHKFAATLEINGSNRAA